MITAKEAHKIARENNEERKEMEQMFNTLITRASNDGLSEITIKTDEIGFSWKYTRPYTVFLVKDFLHEFDFKVYENSKNTEITIEW